MAKAKLGFQKKIEKLDEERGAKQILKEDGADKCWVREMNRWKRKENVGRHLGTAGAEGYT